MFDRTKSRGNYYNNYLSSGYGMKRASTRKNTNIQVVSDIWVDEGNTAAISISKDSVLQFSIE